MRERYLKALENGDLETLPSKTQARGFLRAYADYLGLDSADLLEILDQEDDLPGSPEEVLPAPPPVEPPGQEQARGYFREAGRKLRERRELLGLSLDDVERHTHLRQRYLVALEAGEIDELPSPVQGRGMLNNYAAFLGLDPQPLLLLFADGLQARLTARQAAQPAKRSQKKRRRLPLPASLRRIFSPDVLLGSALVMFLLVFALWGAIRIFAFQAPGEPTATAPSIAEVLLATATASNTPTALPATATSAPADALFPTPALATDASSGEPLPANAQGDVQLYITVRQRAWLRVLVDGEVQYQGRVIPGSAYTYSGEDQIEILTGNGAALYVFLNQQDLGPLGTYGQIVHRIFTVQGVVTATPTITLTPTETSPASATPTASATPRPGEATVPALP
jgi:cytoskeletal protein RodZ